MPDDKKDEFKFKKDEHGLTKIESAQAVVEEVCRKVKAGEYKRDSVLREMFVAIDLLDEACQEIEESEEK